MRTISLVFACAGAFLVAPLAPAAVVYDNIQTSAGYWDDGAGSVVPVIDDLHVDGGGQLSTVTFGYHGFLLGHHTNISILLAIDDGNGVPGEEDLPIFNAWLPDHSVGVGEGFIELDAEPQGAFVEDGDLVWGTIIIESAFTYPLLGDPVAVGSTDPFMFTLIGGEPTLVEGKLAFQLTTIDAGCPEDVNGDDVVDVLDLLAVIAAWGNPGGPEDVNGDGIVDVLDLLAVISAWGPC